MECREDHESLKDIKNYRQKCRYIINFPYSSFKLAYNLELVLRFLRKEALNNTIELNILNEFRIDIGLEEDRLIFIIIARPIHNRDHPRVVVQSITIDLRIDLVLRLLDEAILQFGTPSDNIVRMA